MPDFLQDLTSADGFLPHAVCYLWDPGLVGLHLFTDTLIGLAYVSISFTLTYLVYRARRDIPFHRVFLAFGLFIIACGATHFVEVWTLWVPAYWFSGYVKLVTALASVATAVALPSFVPKSMTLIQTAKLSDQRRVQLEGANAELATLYEKIKGLDELKTEFFANVSHELRTPLALILGPTEKLLASEGLAEEQRRDLEVIERNARTLLKHVNDLLEVARLDAGMMALTYAETDIAHELRLSASHFDLLAHERGIDFVVDAPESVPAQADPEKLRRVFMNLLSNAFKFTPAGGQVHCRLRSDGERATITVEDSGVGVRPELRQAIFERFRQGDGGATRRVGGTGLGLAIVKELIELHGGTVSVDDAPAGGALFTIDLPLAAPTGAAVGVADSESATDELNRPMVVSFVVGEAPETGLTQHASSAPRDYTSAATEPALVLVVEDNPDMNRFIVETLSPMYRTASAFDRRDGLTQALALRPDLILTDSMMPEMSGEQLVAAAQAHPELNDVPIILLTARADDELRVRLLSSGVQDYLIKPFAAEELRARVGNLVATKRARDLLQQELASQSRDVVTLAAEAREAIQVRDEFLSLASHELRTPLGALQGYAELLLRRVQRDGGMDERHQRAVKTIYEQALRLQKLIETMLDVSRIQSRRLVLESRPVDLTALVRQLVEPIQETSERHSLHLVVPEEPLLVEGDELRLEQALQNLVDNAVKYSPQGGRITVQLQREDGQAALSISDQGIGIPPDAVERLFQRFYRAENVDSTRISGLGVGLYLVKEIVTLHGGSVTVGTREGEGSVFTIYLPLLPLWEHNPVPASARGAAEDSE